MDVWSLYLEPYLQSRALVKCLISSHEISHWMQQAIDWTERRLMHQNARVTDYNFRRVDLHWENKSSLNQCTGRPTFLDRTNPQHPENVCSTFFPPAANTPSSTPSATKIPSFAAKISSTPPPIWKWNTLQGYCKTVAVISHQLSGLYAVQWHEDQVARVPRFLFSHIQAISLPFKYEPYLGLLDHLHTLHLYQCAGLRELPSVRALILDACQFQNEACFFKSISKVQNYLDMSSQRWSGVELFPLQCKVVRLHRCDSGRYIPHSGWLKQVQVYSFSECHIPVYDTPKVVEFEMLRSPLTTIQNSSPIPSLKTFSLDLHVRMETDARHFFSIPAFAENVHLRGNYSLEAYLVYGSLAECTHLTLERLFCKDIERVIEHRQILFPKLEECRIRDCRNLKTIPRFLLCPVLHIDDCPKVTLTPDMWIGRRIYVNGILCF